MAKLYFFSGSRDALPGRGVNEVGTPTEFAVLAKIKNWRKVISNFYETPLTYKGKTYMTVEHAFQAVKIGFADAAKADQFAIESGSELAKGGGVAARKARKIVTLNAAQQKQWRSVASDVMRELWEIKFSQGLPKEVLLATNQAELWHGAPRIPKERWDDLETIRSKIFAPFSLLGKRPRSE